TSILSRRLRAGAVLIPLADAEMRARLDQLAAASQGRHQAVAELARDVRFHYFDEPVLDALRERAYEQTRAALNSLADDPAGPDRQASLDVAIRCPQPMRGELLRRWLASSDQRFRQVVLEIYVRRFYRTREL